MAGNRAIFDRAMEQCRDASAQGRWEDSLRAAVRALQEFPQDLEARTAAAVALFQTNRFDKALQAFRDLYETDRTNAFFSAILLNAISGKVTLRRRLMLIER